MNAAEQLDRLGDRLAAEIGRIREALHAGAPVDTDRLAGIVDEIHPLSEQLDPDQARRAKPRLLSLLADLDAVEAEMTAAHEALQAQLKGTTTMHRAVTAYNRPPKR